MALSRIVSVALALSAAAQDVSAQCEADRIVPPGSVEGDRFGSAVAVEGDLALAGAVLHDGGRGAVYVLERGASGWTQTAELTASDPIPSAYFGAAVALSGDLALIGAWNADGPVLRSGAAYVFERTPQGWIERQKLVASNATGSAGFGFSVAIAGDLAVVGATFADTTGFATGAAYVFERVAGVWVERQRLDSGLPDPVQGFGHSVVTDGSVVAIGRDAVFYPGRVSVFERVGGVFAPAATISSSAGVWDTGFGTALALDGGRLLVGFAAGEALLFQDGPTGWTELAHLAPSDVAPGDGLRSVALRGELAVLGASLQDGVVADQGVAYVFREGCSDWSEAARLEACDPDSGERLGNAVALVGGDVFAGAAYSDDGAGALYLFEVPGLAAREYCTGLACPCGNGVSGGACANSAGGAARMRACGSSSVAADDLVLRVEGLPANRVGLAYFGPQQASAPLGDGVRCVGGSTHRLGLRYSGPAGVVTEGPGIVAYTHFVFGPAGRINSGETWNFQYWYRDPAGPCGTGSNLSSAVEVAFVP